MANSIFNQFCKPFLISIIGCSLIFASSIIQAQSNWYWRNPWPQGNNLKSVNAFSIDKVIAGSSSGAIVSSLDEGANWSIKTTGFTGISHMSFTDTTFGYALAGSNLLKTTDAGNSWISIYDQTVTWGNVSFLDRQRGFAVGYNNLFKSTDGGSRWIQYPTGYDVSLQAVQFVTPQFGWAVGSYSGPPLDQYGVILTTTNGGSNWSATSIPPQSGLTTALFSLHFVSQSTGWVVGVPGIILRTTDSGSNWTIQSSGTTSSLQAVHFLDQDTGWVAGAFGRIYRTTDGGNNWSLRQQGPQLPSLYDIDFADQLNGWAVGNAGGIFSSTDGGVTWMEKSKSATYRTLRSLDFVTSTTGWAVGDDGSIIKTTNGGVGWELAETLATYERLYDVDFSDLKNGWAVGGNGTLIHSSDGGTQWLPQSSGHFGNFRSVASVDSQTAWIVGSHGLILKTTNAGEIWQTVLPDTLIYTWYKVFFLNSAVGWILGDAGAFFKTTDSGETWEGSGSYPATFGTFLSGYFIDPLHGWVVGRNGAMARTTDGGATWNSLSSGTTSDLNDVYFADSAEGWAVGAGGLILHTYDGGALWSSELTDTKNALNAITFLHGSIGIAVGQNGTILTTSRAGMHTPLILSISMPTRLVRPTSGSKIDSVMVIAYDPDGSQNISQVGFVSRHPDGRVSSPIYLQNVGRDTFFTKFIVDSQAVLGYYRWVYFARDFNQNVSDSVSRYIELVDTTMTLVSDHQTLIAQYSLSQNYPNPFNPKTAIEFNLSHFGFVFLKVYNVLGEEVSTIVSQNLDAGHYKVDWDASRFTSGIYFYRLQAGSFVETKKLILLR